MIYLAGRITNNPSYRSQFGAAADKLRAQGYVVFDPAHSNQEGRPLPRIMSYVLDQLCRADTIALLPGWWRSGGARIEWMLARYLGHKVIYL